MERKRNLAAAGWLAFAALSLALSNLALAASPAAADPANASTPSRAIASAGSFDESTSGDDYAVLMEREAVLWEGPANVERRPGPGSETDD